MRELTATNLAQLTADYFEPVLLVKLEFAADPVYVHSGYGVIPYDGNTYLGVGQYGSISALREQAPLNPTPIELNLSGINAALIAATLEAGEFKAPVTVYEGYRQDDGTLADDPRIAWAGWWEHSAIELGAENPLRATAQHDLSVLRERNGARFSDEDQVLRYAADVGFEYLPYMADLRLAWGGGSVGSVIGASTGGVGGQRGMPSLRLD